MLSLSSAREHAVSSVREAQKRYKKQYDKKARTVPFRCGDWALVHFPQDESGKQRKLSRPWHGRHRVTTINGPVATLLTVNFPEEGPIQVHLSQVCPCPPLLPVGSYWYWGNCRCLGRVPQWVERLLQEGPQDSGSDEESIQDAADSPVDPVSDQESVQDIGGIEPPLSTQRDAQPEVTAAPN